MLVRILAETKLKTETSSALSRRWQWNILGQDSTAQKSNLTRSQLRCCLRIENRKKTDEKKKCCRCRFYLRWRTLLLRLRWNFRSYPVGPCRCFSVGVRLSQTGFFPDVSFSSFLRKSCRQCRCRRCRRCPRRCRRCRRSPRRCRRCRRSRCRRCLRCRWRQSCTRVCRKCFALQPTLNDSKQTSPSRKKSYLKKDERRRRRSILIDDVLKSSRSLECTREKFFSWACFEAGNTRVRGWGVGVNDAAGLIQQKSRRKVGRLAEGLFRHVAVNLEQMLLFCKSLQA